MELERLGGGRIALELDDPERALRARLVDLPGDALPGPGMQAETDRPPVADGAELDLGEAGGAGSAPRQEMVPSS
jgi:hypothetical protein